MEGIIVAVRGNEHILAVVGKGDVTQALGLELGGRHHAFGYTVLKIKTGNYTFRAVVSDIKQIGVERVDGHTALGVETAYFVERAPYLPLVVVLVAVAAKCAHDLFGSILERPGGYAADFGAILGSNNYFYFACIGIVIGVGAGGNERKQFVGHHIYNYSLFASDIYRDNVFVVAEIAAVNDNLFLRAASFGGEARYRYRQSRIERFRRFDF